MNRKSSYLLIAAILGLLTGFAAANISLPEFDNSDLNKNKENNYNNTNTTTIDNQSVPENASNLSNVGSRFSYGEGFFEEGERGIWMSESGVLKIESNEEIEYLELEITGVIDNKTLEIRQSGELLKSQEITSRLLDRKSYNKLIVPISFEGDETEVKLRAKEGCSYLPESSDPRCLSFAFGDIRALE